MSSDWKLLERIPRYDGWRIRVRTDRVLDPEGRETTRDVVEHPGAVTIVAQPTPDEVVLVSQYRHAPGVRLLELPAGTREAGEDPDRTAARELREETGFTAETIRRVGTFYTAPGFTDELMVLYHATGLESGEQDLDDDEFIEVSRVDIGDALRMVRDGRIQDAKTIAGLLMVLGGPVGR